MSASYKWVQWNRHKLTYDAILVAIVVAYLLAFIGVSVVTFPPPGEIAVPVLIIRSTATLAILLLHIILMIGPLARLSDRFVPLLYNRRHLGVTFSCIALIHGVVSLLFYGGFGTRDPASAVFAGYDSFASISGFPFEFLGLIALLIFFAMAATSHDFWLANLSPRFWKRLHMLVYSAYGLVILHAAFGAMQSETSWLYAALLLAGVLVIVGLHLAAGLAEWRCDSAATTTDDAGWLDAGTTEQFEDGRARIVCPAAGERIAVFRDGDSFSALTNVCAHQGGPLGEGQIIDGCVTCPWHGYQYRTDSGTSPPPYTEKVPTFQVRIEGDRVLVNTSPKPPGTRVEPAILPGTKPHV